jgi:predicted phosphodiesterase
MRITFISDTHNKHNQVTSSLPGGDLIIHAGDSTGEGYQKEITSF